MCAIVVSFNFYFADTTHSKRTNEILTPQLNLDKNSPTIKKKFKTKYTKHRI